MNLGRLNIIIRMGADKIDTRISKTRPSGKRSWKTCTVEYWSDAWQYHQTSNNYKTRSFDEVLREVKGFFKVHEEEGTYPGGVHLEMTGQVCYRVRYRWCTRYYRRDLGNCYETQESTLKCKPSIRACFPYRRLFKSSPSKTFKRLKTFLHVKAWILYM